MVVHSRPGDDEPAQPATLSPGEARSAVKLGVMRYVLAISFFGAAAGLLLAWLVFGR
jgi:hypothetical protein